jgi:hypothetical protein
VDRKIVIKNLLSVLVFSIFVLLALGSNDGEDKNTNTEKVYQQAPKPRLDYKADTSQIRAELQDKGYNVITVDFGEDQGGMYYISTAIDTKGNYDKETLDIHRIMFDNAIADFYYAQIVDYEFQASWMFRARRQTLEDYFSGKISEPEYIHQVKKIKVK